MALDDNDLHRRGELPEDPAAGLVRLLPPVQRPRDDDPERAYETLEDGRPYLVVPPGDRGWFVATPDGDYRIVRESLVRASLMRHWPDLEVNLQPEDEDKPPKAMTPAQLWGCYGADCDAVYYSYLDKTQFKARPPSTGDLVVKVLHAAPPAPVHHPEVLEFFAVLFGTRNDIMLDWLATAPILNRPTGVPVLLGPNSLGKSMIPLGLSRYFGEAVTDYDNVFKNQFNDALLRGPVVWLDETTEVDARSGRFRKLSANDRHAIEGKNTPAGTLIGCPRIIVSSNSLDPLGLGREDLSAADEDAIGVRIILVDCCLEAKEWLAKRGGRKGTADWVSYPDGRPGRIAETIAWLAAHRKVVPGIRFLVHGDADEWASRIGTRKGLPATIIDAIVSYLALTPQQRQELPEHPFKWDEAYPDHIIVSNQSLRACWLLLLGERPPSHIKVAQALQKLAPAGNEKLAPAIGNRMNGYLVPRAVVPKEDSDARSPS